MSGNLQIGEHSRYRHVLGLVTGDFPAPADVIDLPAASGDQI